MSEMITYEVGYCETPFLTAFSAGTWRRDALLICERGLHSPVACTVLLLRVGTCYWPSCCFRLSLYLCVTVVL